jgi:hypothetical protein
LGGSRASLLLAIALWPKSNQTVWADVVQALQARAWVHVTETAPRGERLELWVSPDAQIEAVRRGGDADLFDYRLKTVRSYRADEETIYRLPQTDRRPPGRYLSAIETIPSLLDKRADKPADKLAFVTDGDDALKIVSQSQRQLTADGKKWIELDFTLRHRDIPDPVQMTLRVDPGSRLPRSWKTVGKMQGEVLTSEAIFDYPDQGPLDLYALGVPKTAKVVDRVPSGDLARIVEGVRAARQRFDHYYAIVVESGETQEWFQGSPTQIWRKGNRWRMERPAVGLDATDVPAVNDPPGWWREQVNRLPTYPVMVCDGSKVHQFNGEFIEADDPLERRFEVRSITTFRVPGLADNPLPVCWSLTEMGLDTSVAPT